MGEVVQNYDMRLCASVTGTALFPRLIESLYHIDKLLEDKSLYIINILDKQTQSLEIE